MANSPQAATGLTILYHKSLAELQEKMQMQMSYRTKRLELKILTDTAAAQVLQFYLDNQEIFEEFETDRPQQFYTEPFQKIILQSEYNLAVKQDFFRFWVFEKGHPSKIIGTVSLHNIRWGSYLSCEIGYKFDQRHWGRGYAKESILKCIGIAFQELNLHRVEAYVLAENTASRKLLESIGFQKEGIKRQSVRMRGVWRDNDLYALVAGDGHWDGIAGKDR